MNLISRIRLTLLFGILFGAILSTANASPKTFQGLPVTTASQQAYDYFVAAQTAQDQGKYIEARELFKRSLDKDPNFSFAWLGLANSASSAEEYQESVDNAALFVDKASRGEKLLYKIARTYFNVNLQERVALSQQLVETYPQSPRAWLVHGNAQGEIKDQKGQRESYAKSIALDGHFVPGYTQMGFSYIFYQPKDFKQGETFMLKAKDLNPGDESVYINLGDAHRAMQALEMASDDYEKASILNSHDAVAFIKKAHVDSFLGRFDLAKQSYQQALQVSDDLNRPYYANYETFIDLHAGRPYQAIEALTELLKKIDKMELAEHQKDSAKMFALTNQVTIALHHKYLEDANKILEQREALQRKISASVNDKDFTRNQQADMAFWRGNLAARKGDLKQAHEFANKNRELVATNNSPRKMEKFHQLEGFINLLSEKFSDAKNHYLKADQNDIYVKYHLALVNELSGDKQKARQLFKEVAQYNFNSVEYALIRKEAMSKSSI